MKKPAKVFKKYFIPHDENENRPYILRPRAIAMVCLVVIIAESAFFVGSSIAPRIKLFGIIQTNALVDETNESRTMNDLAALTVSPLLQAAAQEKANDMATKGYFAHTSPQGVTPWYWFQNVGYSFSYAGENLAVNFSDSQDVTNAWMNSPEHRANILSGDFTQIGMATAQGEYNGHSAIYVVELFGTPAASPVAFVNTAAAASIPTTAPMPTVAAAKTPASQTKNSAPATKPSTEPVVKPVAIIPTVVAMQSSTATSSQGSSVAVKGAAIASPTQIAEATPVSQTSTIVVLPPITETAPANAPVPQNAPAAAPAAQGNFIQKLFANPRQVTNDFYIALMVIFGLALILNIFIKIRIQYPRLIAGGMIVIVASGLCIMLNQNIALIHAVVR